MLKLVNKKKSNLSELLKLGEMYNNLSKEIKILEEQKKHLASQIKESLKIIGVKDDSGSFYVEDDKFIIGSVAKKSMKIDNTKALEFIKQKNLFNLIETAEIVDEEGLLTAFDNGLITLDEIESFINTKINYSILVKEKEELPEVETSELMNVARYKKNGKL